MDFWAQHKDFVLRVLAGAGVFLVALIARGIVYGDDLENETNRNGSLASQIRNLKLMPLERIATLEANGKRLAANAEEFTRQLGWKAGQEDLDLALIERTLSHLRRVRESGGVQQAARDAREAIRADLNGGCGQLRLLVTDDLGDEAGERNIRLADGLGFGAVTSLEPGELPKYLSQLEFVARVVRYALDAKALAVEEIGIETGDDEAIPGANPEFLREYAVRFRIRCATDAVLQIVNRLLAESPGVPLRELRVRRADAPPDTVFLDLTGVVMLVRPGAPFAAPGKEAK